jgi:hypothetical protein
MHMAIQSAIATVLSVNRTAALSISQLYFASTAVRLKVKENQLVGVFGEIGVPIDGLNGA